MPNEKSILAENDTMNWRSTMFKGDPVVPMPMACPGGLQYLIKKDVSISLASGKNVHIVVPEQLQQDDEFLSLLGKKFFDAKAASLHLYLDGKYGESPFQDFDFSIQARATAIAENGLTEPGEKIPGSDVVRKNILSPLIKSGELVWIYGPEKSGKSWLSRTLAHVISYGADFLGKYQAASGLRVLYIDSEMPPDALEAASAKELAGLGFRDGRKFAIMAAKAIDNLSAEINLLLKDCQDRFDRIFPKYDVIFLDCYYSLTSSNVMPKELLKWLTPWKNKGKTFIIIDHTNKDEDNLQGGADKKRAADLCILVVKQKDQLEDQLIEISFPTVRHLSPEETKPFTLRMVFGNDSFRFELVEVESDTEASLQHEEPQKELRKALAYVWTVVRELDVKNLAKHMAYSSKSIYAWAANVKTQKRKGNSSPEFTAILEQIEHYERLGDEALTQEACRLAKKEPTPQKGKGGKKAIA
jgi:hypothetical protein